MMHLLFLDESYNLAKSLETGYQPLLVLISILIASMASYTAFLISERIATTHGMKKVLWLVSGSVSMGGGVWAMHFIGMLALEISVVVNYDVVLTLISIVPSLLVSLLVLSTNTSLNNNFAQLSIKSVLLGAGIGTMHYTGMMAMQMNAVMVYDPIIFALSIIVAVILANISLRLKLWAENISGQHRSPLITMSAAALMMGIAISSMHYMGMAAVYFFPMDTMTHSFNQTSEWHSQTLAQIVVICSLLFLIVLVTLVHISRRQELINKLKMSEANIRTIIENVANGVLTFTSDGTILSVNRALEKMFGYSKKEFVDIKLQQLLLDSELGYSNQQLINQINNEQFNHFAKTMEISSFRRDGTIFPIDINISSISTTEQVIYLASIQDTTRRKLEEDALKKSNDTLEKLVVERTKNYKFAMDKAEKASAAKSQFLSRMSHELRTPLNAILGFSELLISDTRTPLTDVQNSNMKEINSAGTHLLQLVNDILELSKIEEGGIDFNLEEISLGDILTECMSLVSNQAEKKSISIEYPEDLFRFNLKADYLRVKQVLLNLLTNAVKYNKVGGHILINSEAVDDSNIRICIKDSGAGLTEEQIDKLFTPFERLNETENVEGTGIGLAISKFLIENMGGSIGVDSTPGEGCCFWFELSEASLKA